MQDQFGFLKSGQCDWKLFMPNGLSGFTTWSKPKGVKMIYMMAISGGSGGGGGFTGVSGADRAGGGGGGCSGITRFYGPACMVPDILYISVGVGGQGVGSGGGRGGAGTLSYVTIGPYPSGSVNDFGFTSALGNLFIVSNSLTANVGGNTGTGTTAGAAGGAVGVSAAANMTRGGYAGFFASTAGLVGFIGGVVADGAGAAATNVLSAGVPFSGGAGGSGSTGANVAGGNVTGAYYFNTIPGGTGTGADIHGGAGYSWNPEGNASSFMASTGGSGGAAVDAGVGGNGGKGGFPGSGGGGGGAGTTGGKGGDGGDGCVLIISW